MQSVQPFRRRLVLTLLLSLCLPAQAEEPAAAAAASETTAGATPATEATEGAVPTASEDGAAATAADDTAPQEAAAGAAPAADPASRVTEREAELLARLEARTLGPDFLQLGPEEAPFVVRYAAARAPARGAVLFVPAPGALVSADGATAAVFAEFAGSAWAVIAPQPPLPPPGAGAEAYAGLAAATGERICAALEHLVAEQVPAVALAGVDGAAERLVESLAGCTAESAVGLAASGRWDADVSALAVPVLELLPARDVAALRAAEARATAVAKAGKTDYRRLELADAGGDFTLYGEEVARRLHGWVATLGEPAAAAAPAPPATAAAKP